MRNYCTVFGCWNFAGSRGMCAEHRVRAAQVGRNAKRGDAEERLRPKDEHAVAEGDAPSLPDLPDPDETRRDAA